MLVAGAMKSLGIVSCECWDVEGVDAVEVVGGGGGGVVGCTLA